MKVKDLIAHLQSMPNDELEVKFAYDSGDYWHRIVAANIKEVQEGKVCFSDYHQMDKITDDSDDNSKPVVILSEISIDNSE